MVVKLEEEEWEFPTTNKINAFLWLLQRLFGIVIIAWMALHTYSNYLITLGPEIYEHEIQLYESIPGIQLIYAALGVAIAWHAFYGLTLIIQDLLTSKQPVGEAIKKRKAPLFNREIGTPRNIKMWFFSGRQLPSRPLWSLHRISALTVAFIVLIHFIHIHIIGGPEYFTNWEHVISTYKDPIWMVYYLIFNITISIHGAQGIRIIIMDFTNIEDEKIVRAFAVLIALIGFALLTWIDYTAFTYVNTLG